MPPDFTDFDTLLARLKLYDPEAFNLLYRHSRERLYILANAIVKDSSVAQDLVQEFFIEFWQRRIYLEIKTSLKAYLMQTIRNKAYNYLDKKTTQEKLMLRWQKGELGAYFPSDRLENEALGKHLDAAISRLPPMAAKVFQLHYIEELSHANIAEQLRISKSTVSGHMDRALRQLREDLKKTTKK
jgi:RNA polymerase sigma-70 factor (ECF subfamily)